MKKKPFSIQLIALCYLLAPVVNIVQIAYFNHWPYTGPRSVFYHLNMYEWAILAFFPVVAFGIWRVSRWGYYLCLGFAAFLILHNTWMYFANQRAYSPYVVILFQLVSFGIVGFFVQKHIVTPYFNPNVRWWETDPRYKVSLSAQARFDQTLVKCQVLDISSGGCFVDIQRDMALGDLVWLHVNFNDVPFSVQARVVWVRKTPVGYGLMFTTIDKTEGRKLIAALKELKRQAKKGAKDANEKIVA